MLSNHQVHGTDVGQSSCVSSPPFFVGSSRPRFCTFYSSIPTCTCKGFFIEKYFSPSFIHFCVLREKEFLKVGNTANGATGLLTLSPIPLTIYM